MMINPYKRIKELEDRIKELEGIPNTSIHPKYKTLIEEVQEIEGRMLYKFKSLLDMPHNRYNKATRHITEFEMRMDAQTSMDIDKKIMDIINQPQIKIGNITSLIQTRITMSEMLISIDASYRLASCVYFWKDENLDDYDFEIGDEKISLFKKIGLDSFFLSKPMNNFIPLTNLSAQDLRGFLQYEKELKKLLFKQLKSENVKKEKMTL